MGKYKDVILNGWKMYERIATNDGIILKGKRAALAFMIKNNYTDKNKEKLSKSLEQDGWFSHSSLPEHWLFKKTMKERHGKMFSNENGITLKNIDVAVEYLEKVGNTNSIQNLREFVGPL